MYVRTCQQRQSGLSGYGLGDALVSSLAASIRQVEGYNPNFAGNNNPGNLVYVGPNQNGQSGVTPGAGGFARFQNPSSGQAALEWQIQNYIDRGYNLTQFFNTYAPPNTKNAAGAPQTSAATQAYINTVSSNLGIDPLIPLNSVQASYSGPGSVSFSSDSSSSPDLSATDSSSSPSWYSGLVPDLSSNPSFDLGGGIVLSESDLLLIGGAIVAVVVLRSIL